MLQVAILKILYYLPKSICPGNFGKVSSLLLREIPNKHIDV